jgi:hypothetical protein
MKFKKPILITILATVVIIIIIAILLFPKPCSYINFAWGAVKRDCDCLGYQVDNFCRAPDGSPCPDAGEGTSCIGIVTKKKCYDYQGYNQGEYIWKQIPCR